MSFFTNMTTAQVTLNASSLEKRPTGFLSGQVINTTTTLGTVGAGKKWTILGYTLAGYQSGAGAGDVKILANGNVIAWINPCSTAGTNGNQAIARTFAYNEAPQITAGQTIQHSSNGAALAGVTTLQYIEESV